MPQVEVRGQFVGLAALQYDGIAKTLSGKEVFSKVCRL
jgi:hypothetical protein